MPEGCECIQFGWRKTREREKGRWYREYVELAVIVERVEDFPTDVKERASIPDPLCSLSRGRERERKISITVGLEHVRNVKPRLLPASGLQTLHDVVPGF